VDDLDALLAAVRADWADRTPKLALADKLQEHGRDREAFKWRVIAEPWDDGHRLAFADACEREADRPCDECDGTGRLYGVKRHEPPNCRHCRGGLVSALLREWAEFVRAQVELVKPLECEAPAFTGNGVLQCAEWNGRHPDRNNWCEPCASRRDLRRRERELFRNSGPRWWDPLPGHWRATVEGNSAIETADGIRYEIARGFVSSISCPWDAWHPHGDAVREHQPVEHVALTTWPDVGGEYVEPERYLLARVAGMQIKIHDDEAPAATGEEIEEFRLYGLAARCILLPILSRRWPGITFTLPERRPGVGLSFRL
jgi:uncharacterized protein (TIGR02996 family)